MLFDIIKARFNSPSFLAMDFGGNLFVADRGNNRIRMIANGTGIISTVAGSGSLLGDGGAATSALLLSPFQVCVDAQANIWIADS